MSDKKQVSDNPTTPSAEAMAAATELHRHSWHVMDHDEGVGLGAEIIERHFAPLRERIAELREELEDANVRAACEAQGNHDHFQETLRLRDRIAELERGIDEYHEKWTRQEQKNSRLREALQGLVTTHGLRHKSDQDLQNLLAGMDHGPRDALIVYKLLEARRALEESDG